ncbi:unnamed protein product [Spirodela intermedia]|uniref:Uncharacterized protein n=1 Tax=Spirodela intermedia TaxID=51605 RepID=A0ABN7EAI9_SPIIN|nr:unnamed protein product [Spirodela intermedia]
MKWVVESSLAVVTRQSGKTVTLRLFGGCHRWRGAGWRWGACQGLHPQVCAVRGGSSSRLHKLLIKEVMTLVFESLNDGIELIIVSRLLYLSTKLLVLGQLHAIVQQVWE